MTTTRPAIAIFNSSRDAISVLEEWLQPEFTTVRSYVREFRLGEKDLGDFMREHAPAAVVWDVSMPYYQNWTFLQAVRQAGTLKQCPLVPTSPHPTRLDEIVGLETGALEMTDHPECLKRIADTLRRTVGSADRS